MLTIRLKDVLVGDCWRFVDVDDPPDTKPTLTIWTGTKRPDALPDSWDSYDTNDETDDKECSSFYRKHKDRPIELLEHWTWSIAPRPLNLRRRDLDVGDCFQYIDMDDEGCLSVNYIVNNAGSDPDRPEGWMISSPRSAANRMNSRVRRIPHWSTPNEPSVEPGARPTPTPPTVLESFLQRTAGYKEKITGAECLRRLEGAMRTDSLVRARDSSGREVGVVSTHAEFALDYAQYQHGILCWEAKLAHLQREERRKGQLVVDDQCEMPNMAIVEDDE